MHWICSTRHGNQTTTYSHFISIKTRIIEVITSNNRCHSHSHSSRSSSGDIDGGTNDKHDNNDSDGGVLSKSKCKTLFSRHFARILIVILVSFTFADMVHGKCHILWNPNFMLFTNDQTKTLSSIPCDSQLAHTHTHTLTTAIFRANRIRRATICVTNQVISVQHFRFCHVSSQVSCNFCMHMPFSKRTRFTVFNGLICEVHRFA